MCDLVKIFSMCISKISTFYNICWKKIKYINDLSCVIVCVKMTNIASKNERRKYHFKANLPFFLSFIK